MLLLLQPAAMFKVLRETPPIPETLSPEGRDFLRCCFIRNPAERPSASMLLEHRFMKNSQQTDFSSGNQALNGMKLLDKAHSQAERPTSIYKLDHVPVSTGAQSTRGKVAYSETGQGSSGETSEWTVAPPSFSSFYSWAPSYFILFRLGPAHRSFPKFHEEGC